ncbi:probable cytochrome P450 6a13 isoform X1 [Homalodisca vitripennis]|uniref:probable cytochrome P450 6a13 isoform X1 n=2 Tax=Homalodisca vitripennis TaxID=197043 RepID=UPI001EEB7EBF|nr:probable cytochrome P450 6a13 isoform X1 [Homalodisca vitripennis]
MWNFCHIQKMGLLMGSLLLELFCLVPLLIYFFYKYHTKNYNYWKNLGVPYKEGTFPFGSIKELTLRKAHAAEAYNKVYKEFQGERFFGLIENGKPSLVIRDPELVKQILVKDFQHFVDRSPLIVIPKDGISRNLALLSGKEWKNMRHKLTPTFTSGKMKMMFILMEKCSEQLKEFLVAKVEENKPIDAKDLLGRFTMDIIAACAFGLDSNSLRGNSEFVEKLGGLMKSSRPPFSAQMILMFVPELLLRIIPVKLTKPEVREFLLNVVRDAVAYREKNNITRNDFLDLLIKIRNNKSVDDDIKSAGNTTSESESGVGLTIEEMTAQAFVFFIAGFETASSVMSFCLFELSRHQDIQDSVYAELQEALKRNGGSINYQMLMEVPFLEQVINETLRLYGSVPTLTRCCTQRYHIPDSNVVMEKGHRVIIPSYSFHHDPQYYPDPYEFKPERFAPENSKERHPYVFLPFGEGPRNCIGMRFGLMQTKLGLATVILNFKVHLAPEQEIPIKFSTTSTVTQPENGVLLNFIARTEVS